MIHFAYPQVLWLLASLPLLALWRGRRGAEPAIDYPDTQLLRAAARATRSRPGRWLAGLKLLALALLIVALARPQLGHRSGDIQANGVDIMLALDVSGSMESLDFRLDGRPASRLDVVKSVVGKFIAQRPNDRIGLTIFAGEPYLVSPVTLDHAWLLRNLDRVRIGSIEDGTAIGSAIAASVNRLRDQAAKSKLVVLMTDGQNNAGGITPATAAEAARALGVKVYTIGIGVRGAAPIPVTDAFGNRQLVMQKVDVDEATLGQIASETDARFYRATDTGSLRQIYADIDRLEKTRYTVRTFQQWQELYYWVVMAALATLATGLLLEQTLMRRLPAGHA